MPRIEYPGAIYHVINRGNYRRDLFSSPGAAESFLGVLAEAAKRYEWEVGAFVLMRNHYHLALRTPHANLSRGMQWLQVTFAARFNRFRQETGHLFQGRYRAIVLENEWVWAEVCDYIHLNPVRARIVEPEFVDKFRWSSLMRFLKGPRFPGLDPAAWLGSRKLTDSQAGWAHYLEDLRAKVSNRGGQSDFGESDESWSRGWAMGSDEWRADLAERFAKKVKATPSAEYALAAPAEALRWRKRLDELLASRGAEGMNQGSSASGRKNVKVEIAGHLREELGAPVVWLAKELGFTSAGSLRVSLHRQRKRVNK